MAQITTDEQGRFRFIAPRGKKLTLRITDPEMPAYPITHDLGECNKSLHVLRNIDDIVYEETKVVGNWVVVDAAREFPALPYFKPYEDKTLRNYISDAFAEVRTALNEVEEVGGIPLKASDIQDYQMIWESPTGEAPNLNSHVLIPYPYGTSPKKNRYYMAIVGVKHDYKLDYYSIVKKGWIDESSFVNDGIILSTQYDSHAIIAIGWIPKVRCSCSYTDTKYVSSKPVCVREANSWADGVYANVCRNCGARYNAYDTPPTECESQGHLLPGESYRGINNSTWNAPLASDDCICKVCHSSRVLMNSQVRVKQCYHVYSDWEVIQAPTTTSTGIAQMHCIRCKTYWRKIIPMIKS